MGMHHAREWPAARDRRWSSPLPGAQFGTDAAVTELLQQRARRDRAGHQRGRLPWPRARTRASPTHPATRAALRPGRGGRAPAAPRLPAQELRRRSSPDPATPCDAAVRRRPEPQLRRAAGAATAPARPEHADLPRHRPVVGARDPGRPRVLAAHHGHDADHAAQRRGARAAPAGPAHATGKAPDEDALKELGDAMADATGYTSQYGYQLYDTSGTTEDWNYAAQRHLRLHDRDRRPEGGNFHMPYQTRRRRPVDRRPAPAPGAACARRSCASPNGRLRVRTSRLSTAARRRAASCA